MKKILFLMFLLFLIAFSWGAEKVEKIILTGGV